MKRENCTNLNCLTLAYFHLVRWKGLPRSDKDLVTTGAWVGGEVEGSPLGLAFCCGLSSCQKWLVNEFPVKPLDLKQQQRISLNLGEIDVGVSLDIVLFPTQKPDGFARCLR